MALATCGVIVSGGKGARMGTDQRKQYLSLCGRPILAWTLRAFESCPSISSIVLVVPQHDTLVDSIIEAEKPGKLVAIATGGKERQDSVLAGLKQVPVGATHVAVHDGVRPLVTPDEIGRVVEAAYEHNAAMLAAPSRDTLKQVDSDGRVISTLPRESIWRAQTPQVFTRSLLQQAYQGAIQAGFVASDDAAVVAAFGAPVFIVESTEANLKITTPVDLVIAEAIMGSRLRGGLT